MYCNFESAEEGPFFINHLVGENEGSGAPVFQDFVDELFHNGFILLVKFLA